MPGTTGDSLYDRRPLFRQARGRSLLCGWLAPAPQLHALALPPFAAADRCLSIAPVDKRETQLHPWRRNNPTFHPLPICSCVVTHYAKEGPMFSFSSTPAKQGSRVTPLHAATVSRCVHGAINLHQHPIASSLPTYHRRPDATRLGSVAPYAPEAKYQVRRPNSHPSSAPGLPIISRVSRRAACVSLEPQAMSSPTQVLTKVNSV